MTTDRHNRLQELRKKVRALRRLERRAATEGEAQAAAFAIGKLLTKHQIDIGDLEVDEDREVPAMQEEPLDSMKQAKAWRMSLAVSVCSHCGVAGWLNILKIGGRTVWTKHMMCGRPTDVEAARGLFAWLTTEAKRLRVASGCDRQHANDWLRGFAQGVRDQLAAAKREAINEAPQGSSVAIVLASRMAEAEAVLKEANGEMEKHRTRRHRVSMNAYDEGRANGRAVHLGKNLGEAKAVPALGAGPSTE